MYPVPLETQAVGGGQACSGKDGHGQLLDTAASPPLRRIPRLTIHSVLSGHRWDRKEDQPPPLGLLTQPAILPLLLPVCPDQAPLPKDTWSDPSPTMALGSQPARDTEGQGLGLTAAGRYELL